MKRNYWLDLLLGQHGMNSLKLVEIFPDLENRDGLFYKK